MKTFLRVALVPVLLFGAWASAMVLSEMAKPRSVAADPPQARLRLSDDQINDPVNDRTGDKVWVAFHQAKPADPPAPKFKTGARRTPQNVIAKAIADGSLRIHRATTTTPAQWAMVPKQLSMWLNDQEGDCVSAEEAFQIAAYSQAATGTEYFVQDATVQAFCSAHNACNGADLMEIIQAMQKTGMKQGGDTITDGVSSVVDYSTESILQNALSQGPVKIAIDASALPSGAGNQSGWSKFGGRPGQYTNTDHCVALCGYGPTVWLCQQLGTPVPTNAPANSYLLYTWKTIGLVDHPWVVSTTTEAYLRGSLIINGKALPPLSPTPPVTVPVPNVVGMDWTVAQTTLTAAGLVPVSFKTSGTVYSESPLAGTQVAPGSTVTCVLSSPGPGPSPGLVSSAQLTYPDGSTQTLVPQTPARTGVQITYTLDANGNVTGMALKDVPSKGDAPPVKAAPPKTLKADDGWLDWTWDEGKQVYTRPVRPTYAPVYAPVYADPFAGACGPGGCAVPTVPTRFGRWR